MVWKWRLKSKILLGSFIILFFVLLYSLNRSLPNVSGTNHFQLEDVTNLTRNLFYQLCDVADLCECSTQDKHLYKGESEDEVVNQIPKNYLAVIVPFRNGFDELIEFVPHLHQFLLNQSILHEIFIVNQNDDYRFNRASLINVGFKYAIEMKKFDYLVMHDVDLLPLNPELKYLNPGNGFALHIASPKLHPEYHYETFVGGILMLTVGDYQQLNGLSNKYWGWGHEDDEFYQRIKKGGITILRPENITAKENFRHIHDGKKRIRDQQQCYDQNVVSQKRDNVTGLSDVTYSIKSVSSLEIDSAPATLLNILLHCNKTMTPWCSCS